MKNWKAIIGVGLVFLLGMLAGGLVTLRFTKKRLQRVAHGEPAYTADEIVRVMGYRLKLNAIQRDQLRPIVAATQQQLQTIRKQSEPQVLSAIQTAISQVRALLRPDQCEEFDRLVAERRGQWNSP